MNWPARLASKVAARFGLPMARMSEPTIAASALSTASAAALSHATRFPVVLSWLARNAACAFSTAASTTAASDSAIRETGASSIGETSGKKTVLESVRAAPPIHGRRRGVSLSFAGTLVSMSFMDFIPLNGRAKLRSTTALVLLRHQLASYDQHELMVIQSIDANARSLDDLFPFRPFA